MQESVGILAIGLGKGDADRGIDGDLTLRAGSRLTPPNATPHTLLFPREGRREATSNSWLLIAGDDVDFGLARMKPAERMTRRNQFDAEATAWIEGAPASLEDEAAVAARLLARSGQPLIAGLGTDIEGARAANALAERPAALLRDLDCLRETGVMLTTPGEARVRADVLLLIGDALRETWPALNERLLRPPARPDGVDVTRRHCHVGQE